MGTLPPRAALRLLGLLPAIRRHLRRLGIASHDVDDVAAVVILGAVEAWPRYDPSKGTLGAWVDGITRNQASHHRERAHVRREWLGGLDPCPELATEETTPEEALDVGRELAAVLPAVLRLPPLEREVLAGVVAGDSMAALASRLALPASTLYKALYRARATLERTRRRVRSGRSREPPKRPSEG